jgi:hypothetical protein
LVTILALPAMDEYNANEGHTGHNPCFTEELQRQITITALRPHSRRASFRSWFP